MAKPDALTPQALDAGFEMMVSALRIVIERAPDSGARVPDAAKVERRIGVLTEFVIGGCLRLAVGRNGQWQPTDFVTDPGTCEIDSGAGVADCCGRSATPSRS